MASIHPGQRSVGGTESLSEQDKEDMARLGYSQELRVSGPLRNESLAIL
jgi:hypothetical protein